MDSINNISNAAQLSEVNWDNKIYLRWSQN
jgi:hypothetical protein